MPIFSFDFPRNRNIRPFVFLPVLLLGLSACGGGGGGSSGFSSNSEDAPGVTSAERSTVGSNTRNGNTSSQNTNNGNSGSGNTQQALRFPSKAKVSEVSSAIWEAAKARPKEYARTGANPQSAFTQSSQSTIHGEEDDALLEWLYTPTGDFDGELRLWASFYTDSRGRGLVGQRERSVQDIVRTEVRNVNGHAWADMVFYRKWTADDVDNLMYFDRYAAFGPGEIWVYAHTDADGDGDGTPGEQNDREDSDYLAGGVWVYVPETFEECDNTSQNAPICNEYEVGVFVNGNDPFETSSMWALEGTATYDGRAIGIFSGTAGQSYFRANAEMTLSFGSSVDAGVIRGRIFDFVGENGSRMPGNPVVQLQSGINFDNVEYVFGTTSHNDGTDSFTGQWAGRFYGSSHASGIPTSVGGTFGASTSDGSKTYLGAFGTHLDTYDATNFTLPQ